MESAGNLIYWLLCKILWLGKICVVMSGVVALMCCAYVLTDAQIVYRSAELPVEIISLDPELEASRG